MIPERIVRSIEELQALAQGSLVCAPYYPEDVYQRDGNGFIETVCEETHTPASVWETMTGDYERYVRDEDREVWVIWDAANTMTRPDRGDDSPDWMTVIDGRTPAEMLHESEDEAKQALTGYLDEQGHATERLRIFYRPKTELAFRLKHYVGPGGIPEWAVSKG